MTTKIELTLEKYKQIVEQANEGIWALDGDGRIDYINERGAAIMGYKPEEMLGRPATDFVLTDNLKDAERRLEALKKGQIERFDYRLLHKDGSIVWTTGTTQPLYNDNGEYVGSLAMSSNITDRKRMEEALKESEERFAKLFYNSPVPMSIIEPGTGRHIDANDVWLKNVRYRLEEIIGRTAVELGIMDPEIHAKALESASNGDFSDFGEVLVRRKDGEERTILTRVNELELQGQNVQLTTSIDITDRKRAEEALRESEEQLRSVLDNSRDAIYRFNLQTNRYEYFSPAFEQVVGYSAEEMLSKNIDETWAMVHPDDISGLNEAMVWLSENGSLDYDYRIRDKSGNYRWVSNRISIIKDDSGRPHYRDGIIRNITREKEVEGDLKRSNAELQQFAYIASHDLQEPLRMVMSYLALLNKKYADELPAQAKEYMSTATEGAERMRQLVNDLLTFSRIDTKAVDFTAVNMNKVVEAVRNELHFAIEEVDAEVIVDTLPAVLGDESQLKQLLTNLVSNAVKFHNDERPKIEISCTKDRNEWTFAVKDNGIGIDPRYHDRVFQMFQRLHTRDEYSGTGIGLAVAQKIVERHGGRIWVESEQGRGATFYFTIPR